MSLQKIFHQQGYGMVMSLEGEMVAVEEMNLRVGLVATERQRAG